MRPRFHAAGAKEPKWWEYALRFVFGGVVSAAIGLVSHAWGPVVAGLFLGFPSIFPASITLVKQHDGRAKAVDDARGARLGSLGLVAFGVVVCAAAQEWPPAVTLAAATVAWTMVDLGAWAIVYGTRPEGGPYTSTS